MKNGEKRTRNANGQGHFLPMQDGRYRLKKQHGYLENGNPRILTVTGKTKSECIKLMNQKIQENDSASDIRKKAMNVTLTQLCLAHLGYEIKNELIEETSADRRQVTIRNQIANADIGKKKLSEITGAEIYDYILSLCKASKLSMSTIEKVVLAIDAAYKWAVKRNYVDKNPLEPFTTELKKRLEKNKITRNEGQQVITLLRQDVEKLENIATVRNNNNGKIKYPVAIYMLFLLYTGMRSGELCSLRWSDIERVEGKILVNIYKTRKNSINRKSEVPQRRPVEGKTKNKKYRTIELDEKAIYYLGQLEKLNPEHDENEYLVLNRAKKPTEPSKFSKRIKTIYQLIDVSEGVKGAHALRRTFATLKYNEGVSVDAIAEYIGDLKSTVEQYYINKKATLEYMDEGRKSYVRKL